MKKYAIFLDLLLVLLFDVIGRSSHGHHLNLAGVANTFWPFATGVIVGWLVTRSINRNPLTKENGFMIALVTVVIGMLLRVVSGQGTAFTFILVATLFLSIFLVGWRYVLSASKRFK